LPDESTVPPSASDTDQNTSVDCPFIVPVTVAVKVTEPLVWRDAAWGEIETAIVTVTVAVALCEGSATLVATTW
jgi:hypothetical protein